MRRTPWAHSQLTAAPIHSGQRDWAAVGDSDPQALIQGSGMTDLQAHHTGLGGIIEQPVLTDLVTDTLLSIFINCSE